MGVVDSQDPLAGVEGPSDAELAALVTEEHLIAAELARLEAELVMLPGGGGVW